MPCRSDFGLFCVGSGKVCRSHSFPLLIFIYLFFKLMRMPENFKLHRWLPYFLGPMTWRDLGDGLSFVADRCSALPRVWPPWDLAQPVEVGRAVACVSLVCAVLARSPDGPHFTS